MAYKLQHWLVTVEYMPGVENTMADALSQEERPRKVTPVDLDNPDVSLAVGDVGAAPTHEEPVRETRQRGVPRQEECAVAGTTHEERERETLKREGPKHTEGVRVATPT